ncbi:peptidoglycan/LPS O-acetylase OafA/YrhL [Lewinella aquimaris]|uniref:Peptidoglycan/LPS O-acetylase OafA/YrhL n=1 Tax=Neolewinella aquimaris TaxID=1835722 RepID=A0A840EH33_9BACT|nr:acyltransferase family protein [Neolewinella aquimaris]MBB4080216.1 peptidoglycan/LPS O-acetylase OafA/YrhL [Neolewinella aquimaris]
MKYRPEIDGLRALAVVPVILFHAGFMVCSGGFVGVDMFFVISGYLITTIIATELDKGTFSIINFYERRARRILPALFLILTCTLPFAWTWLLPSDMKDYSESLVAVSTYWSNILFWKEVDYWDTLSELKPLLHTWTLAVEEQYYVFFPLFLMAVWSFKKLWIFILLLGLTVVSLVVAQWGSIAHPDAAFYLLPTRGWELAIGAIVAFLFCYHKRLMKNVLSSKTANEGMGVIGLLMIGYSVFYYDESVPFPGVYALMPTVGTALIVVFTSTETWVGKLLGIKPLVTIGLISYSAYLWHQPIFAFFRYQSVTVPDANTLLLLSVAVFPISYLSWRFVENPFRNKKKFDRKAVFVYSLIGSLVFLTIGTVGMLTNGYEQRDSIKKLVVRNYQPDNTALRKESWSGLINLANDDDYGVDGNAFDNTLWFDLKDQRPKILVVGNSYSKDMFNDISHSKRIAQQFQLARYGVQIKNMTAPNAKIYRSPNYKEADIILIATWFYDADLDALPIILDKLEQDNKNAVLMTGEFKFTNVGFRTAADRIVQEALFGEDHLDNLDVPDLVDRVDSIYYQELVQDSHQQREIDRRLQDLQANHTELLIVNRLEYMCDSLAERCFMINDQLEKYLYDSGHHTLAGSKFYGVRIDSVGWLEGLDKFRVK